MITVKTLLAFLYFLNFDLPKTFQRIIILPTLKVAYIINAYYLCKKTLTRIGEELAR